MFFRGTFGKQPLQFSSDAETYIQIHSILDFTNLYSGDDSHVAVRYIYIDIYIDIYI